ncbi:MAG: hypothetical protein JWL96_2463 [Sphingomonas bacterium]|uniref:hypothetical protein n=1 Tax=Sphingomonas bacterium TaxID=1895847 RepID=UPI00262ECD4B|nr:hypothetical protein [Sphingomonas bacterium]MDB5710393.1 hypothetical protein [Sphingomonas bacterium]
MTAVTVIEPAMALPESAPVAGDAARPVLNFWVFGAPYLVTIVFFFTRLTDDDRIFAPIFPVVITAAAAAIAILIKRRLPEINRELVMFMLAYAALGVLSVLLNGNNDLYALRKIGLPLVCMAPGVFRYYTTGRQMVPFLAALFVVALVYTTQTSQVEAGGLFTTDSPNESILSVAFGAVAVWLVASSRLTLAALAGIACVFFFKRNAMGAGLVVALLVLAVMWVRRDRAAPLLRRILLVTVPMVAIFAFYLSDLFGFIATNLVRGYDAEYLSVGRAAIYDLIIRDFDRSGLREQLLGHGAGAVENMVSSARSLAPGLQLAHDEYLSWLYDFGIVGLVVLLVMLIRLGRSGNAAIAVLLFMVIAMTAENFFLISFNCLAVFALLSTHMVSARPAGDG